MGRDEPLRFPEFPKPAPRVVLWEAARRPDEAAILDELTREGYGVVRYRQEPAAGYGPHAHVYPETMWVVEGNLTILLTSEARMIELLPGDRIDIPQGVAHGVIAGVEGAVYLLATK
jgi:quercetin dioxygenase-like cupin family protein